MGLHGLRTIRDMKYIAMPDNRLNIERDLTLMMTASIIPVEGMQKIGLTRTDPKQREQDYIDSLTYYLTHHPRIRRIAFVENSGASLDRLERVAATLNPHNKDVEFVSVNCNNFPFEFGGGYGEWEMMNLGVSKSRLLSTTKYFAKMTGRQWVLNASAILEKIYEPAEFVCDTQDTSVYRRLGLSEDGRTRKIDARFWVTSIRFYDEHIRYLHRPHTQGIFWAEATLYAAVMAAGSAHRITWRFSKEPNYRGIAGHMNKDYGSWRQKLKRGVRGAIRQVAPHVWI